jgi:outer membrane protein OmpA-like peptidoglycan-associated protein/flagellar hook assembly protein FlgD
VFKKNIYGTVILSFFVAAFLISCATVEKKTGPDAFINPKLEAFNPKSSNSKYSRENFDIGMLVAKKIKIKNWNISIKNSSDQAVLISDNKGELKTSFEWGGKDSSGNYAPDGIYYAVLTINYDFGNPSIVKSKNFSIDTVSLSANVKMSTDVFTPGLGDKKDEVSIIQEKATKKADWSGCIYNEAGNKVKNFSWKNETPVTVVWDGKDDSGKMQADGNYYYQLTASDNVGNSFESEKFDKANLANYKNQVKIYTKGMLLNISTMHDSFNPKSTNTKYTKETFELRSNLSKDTKVVGWKIDVLNTKGETIFSVNEKGELKDAVDWNGNLSSGDLASDGDYYAVLTADLSSGSSSTAKTKLFSLDTIDPSIEIKPVSSIFSPNADGNLDTYDVLQKGSKESNWEATVTAADNTVVWTNIYTGFPNEKEIWYGKDNNGNVQANGIYKYKITGTDKAGNSVSKELTFELKNLETTAVLNTGDNKYISKNSPLDVKPEVSVKDDVDSYKLEILDKNKNVVKTFEGTKTVPDNIEWQGMNETKTLAPDGEYSAKMTINYRFGNKVDVSSKSFILTNLPPEVKASTSPKLFSPDGDGVAEQVTLSLTATDATGIKNWSIRILTPNGKRNFIEFKGNGEPKDKIIWNGKSSTGELVESAEDYPVVVRVENNVGNVYEKSIEAIHVDILVIKLSNGKYKIRVSNILFQPDSSDLTDSPKNMDIINKLSDKLIKFSDYKIIIEGYVNPFVSGKFNKETGKNLSDARAKSIAKLLDKQGISIKRMTSVGKGGDNPIVFKNDKAAKLDDDYLEKNRRVEFYLNK